MSLANKFALPVGGSVSWLPRLIGVGAFFVGWFLLSLNFPNNLMPFPTETIALAVELVVSGRAWDHVYWTLLRTLAGFVGTMILGVTIGVLMGTSSLGRNALNPFVLIGLAVPSLVWGAAGVLVLGFNNLAVVFATVIVVFPFIAIPVWKAVEDIDYDLVDMSDAFDVPRTRVIRRLVMPSIATALASSSRFALSTSFNIVTIGEMLATNNGIGEMIVYTYSLFRYEESWAWLVVFLAIILTIEYVVFKPLERRIFSYREDADFSLLR